MHCNANGWNKTFVHCFLVSKLSHVLDKHGGHSRKIFLCNFFGQTSFWSYFYTYGLDSSTRCGLIYSFEYLSSKRVQTFISRKRDITMYHGHIRGIAACFPVWVGYYQIINCCCPESLTNNISNTVWWYHHSNIR